MKLEGTACYEGFLLAPAEDFSLSLKLLAEEKVFDEYIYHFLKTFLSSVVPKSYLLF